MKRLLCGYSRAVDKKKKRMMNNSQENEQDLPEYHSPRLFMQIVNANKVQLHVERRNQ